MYADNSTFDYIKNCWYIGLDARYVDGKTVCFCCSYDFCDLFISKYEEGATEWDLAIITLTEPIGLTTGWMGVKALPPVGICSPEPFTLAGMEVVGYPVQDDSRRSQWASFCELKVCRTQTKVAAGCPFTITFCIDNE